VRHEAHINFSWGVWLSVRNLKYTRKFAKVYPDSQIVQALLAQLPWLKLRRGLYSIKLKMSWIERN